MKVQRKITISPDILQMIGYDEEGISVSVEDDMVCWSDTEDDIHVVGMSEWQAWFEHVTDFVKGDMKASFIDIIKWHSKGLYLAKELKRKLPDDVEVWYDKPFEDKSYILKESVRIYK